MQHVMVHIDNELGPIGAWSYLDDELTHFYPPSLDMAIPARARQAMAARSDMPVPEWFDYLAASPKPDDEYRTVEIADGVSLVAILAEFRRAWNTDS